MIRTLIVEDDAIVAEVNRDYTTRVPGFTVAGVVHTGVDAIAFTAREHVDVVLLDFYLPDMTGLELCRALRPGARGHGSRAGHPRAVDVIAVTAARDAETVRAAVAYGVVQYLIKPFSFATFREKLERYASYHQRLADGGLTDQHEVDRALRALRDSSTLGLPKGLSTATYELVAGALRGSAKELTASETAELTGLSRVSARRYLEHLVHQGLVVLSLRYGTAGRPEHCYRWAVARGGRGASNT
jgi:response regulator of citrate/malate metabolism